MQTRPIQTNGFLPASAAIFRLVELWFELLVAFVHHFLQFVKWLADNF